MKHFFILPYLLIGHFFVSAQEKMRLLEGQFNTAGDVTVTFSANGSKTVGLTEESKKAAEGILIQRELSTGIKILTLKEGRGKTLSPLTLVMSPEYTTQLELLKGDLTLTGITGNIDAATQAGNLTIKQLNARVRLRTGKGDIQAAESTLTGDLVTQSGNIILSDVNGPYVTLAKDGQVRASFSERFFSDMTKVFSFGLFQGSIQAIGARAGGAFELARGNIIVQKSRQQVAAIVTEGGDIRLEGVSGQVRARTAKGSIWTEISPEATKETLPIEIENSGGDVTVLLPKDLQGILVIEVSQTQHFEVKNKVESTIDFKADWEELKGEKETLLGRSFRVTQRLGDSKRVIRLRVRNGHLVIKTY